MTICATGWHGVALPMLLSSRKGIILSNVIKKFHETRARKAPVELWMKRVLRRVLDTLLFWRNLGQKKFSFFPFRLDEVQILLINNCIKLHCQITSCEKESSQFSHVERWNWFFNCINEIYLDSGMQWAKNRATFFRDDLHWVAMYERGALIAWLDTLM